MPDPLIAASAVPANTADRLAAYTAPGENGCLEFIGTLSMGYGKIRVNGKKVAAHRLAYILAKGPIPEGLFVLHSCDNPACVNPEHLFVGTQKDNVNDMILKGRQAQVRGELQARSILKVEQVKEIKRLLQSQSLSYTEIANRYNVSNAVIKGIAYGKNWSWVNV